jgi:cytochrome c5
MVASPKFGSQNDWGSRLMSKKDINGLVKVAIKGTGAMPAKGLCTECKEKDLKAAIVYMMRGQE